MEQLASFLKLFLGKTFDIREGEFRKVLLMQLNIFLIIFVLLIIKPVVNALFLSRVGVDELPIVFVLVAVSAMVVSTMYARAMHRRSIRSLTALTLWVSILGLVMMSGLLYLNVTENLVLYLMYIGIAIFGVMATSQFWIMANLAFDGREAKRLFGFIGVGPIAGGVVGGYVTSLLAPHLSAGELLLVAAFLLSFCIPLNGWIWKKHIQPLNQFQRKKRLKGFSDHPLKLIRNSKHLSYLALLVGLGVIVTKLVDFQFSSVASEAYPDADDLTSFLAFWFSTFNVISLVIQLFLTRRIVGTFGVGTSLYALPGGVLVGSVLLLFAPVLWAGIFTKMWEVSVKQSVNKAATELLALPIPIGLKSQTKSFIDVFVDMAATGVSGLLLIVIVRGFDLSVRAVSVMTIGIVCVWIWVALKVRKEYILSFKAKLTQADQKATKPLTDFGAQSVLNGLKNALNMGTDKQVVFVLKKVKEIPDARLFDNVAQFLSHPSPKVRAEALSCISYLNKSVDSETLNRLISDSDDEVRQNAFTQLFKQTNDNPMALVSRYLQDEDPYISGSALLAIAQEARNNPEMKRLMKLEKRINEKMEYALLADSENERLYFKVVAIKAAGKVNLGTFYPLILEGLQDPRDQVEHAAIEAAGATLNDEFITALALKLVAKETRKRAEEALLNYGDPVIGYLEKLILSREVNAEVVGRIPSVIEKINSQIAADALMGLLKIPDVNLKLESLRSLNAIQRDFPHLKIRKEEIIERIIEETSQYMIVVGVLLQQANIGHDGEQDEILKARQELQSMLERRIDGTLERIFRLLGLRYPADEVSSVYKGIQSVDPQMRSNSVDFLDNLLEPNLKRVLLPVAELAVNESLSSQVISNNQVQNLSETEGLEILLKGRDPRLKLSVFRLVEAINEAAYIDIIRAFQTSPIEKVREYAVLIVTQFDQGRKR